MSIKINKVLKLLVVLFSGFVIIAISGSCSNDKSNKRSINFVAAEKVKITDDFWLPILERNRLVTIPYAFKKCAETGRIENFVVAAGKSKNKFQGERYNDTDVFKIIEGAANTLKTYPDSVLELFVDSLITIIGEAQESDGYLYTARSADPANPAPGAGRDRWIDEWISHELYNAGHLYEAAVAYYEATGKKNLLDVAVKNADLVCKEFGWGRREAAPGHQEIEIGLLKLYEVTGNDKYLKQAKFFLDVRGRNQTHEIYPEGTRFAIYNNKEYLQQDLPIMEQTDVKGHAVRVTYMYTALTMLSNLTEDKSYLTKSEELWNNVLTKKIYLTGGVGSEGEGEAFGKAYYLPNASAYNETCASIGEVFWNKELFNATGDAHYINVMERVLYNGLISGISQDGKSFFYPNPLSSPGNYTRSPWFGVSCCPGNLCRFFPQIPGLIYAFSDKNIFVNLFISSSTNISIRGNDIKIGQETKYPWDGKIVLSINPEKSSDFNINVRIPSWLNNSPFYGDLYTYTDSATISPVIRVNNKITDCKTVNGYANITKTWQSGDKIVVEFPMSVRTVKANTNVVADSGKIAFERGPVVFCLEEADNGKVAGVVLKKNVKTSFEFDKTILSGTGIIKIYDTLKQFTAVPYYLWSNRKIGEMEVWINTDTN
jgi:DUF1680 family protein